MSEQRAFAFPKPKPSPLERYQRTHEENRNCAAIVLRRPDIYGKGLVAWAKLVLQREATESETR